MNVFENDWADVLKEEMEKPYYLALREKLKSEYNSEKIFPDMYDIFAAFHHTSFENTKVVIIGQDPYHGEGQAHGLSFSVRKEAAIPPSLRNIYKELEDDLGIHTPAHGDLSYWASQGVLLLNNVLTVRAHQAHSHRNLGWERFTDHVIDVLNKRERPAVFMLWGKPAQKKAASVDAAKHCVIESAHPSPLAAYKGFFGSRPFSKANRFLKSKGEDPIDWEIKD
ncbi:uracil-DNA glycosylase [Halobacillus massiliensis]|uniref:uracil-DNA glycosylase n=1 Tax=Halobacillus massiliensis TaxID=1926286 RepID=UPI0009E37C2F|nr:uracil-DNA glycosylase [Halobacillus massiliensis]